MSSVLTVEQREQAGSDSYTRFEYQVHWIVCHIIGKLQEDAECIVFCEFHPLRQFCLGGIFFTNNSQKVLLCLQGNVL